MSVCLSVCSAVREGRKSDSEDGLGGSIEQPSNCNRLLVVKCFLFAHCIALDCIASNCIASLRQRISTTACTHHRDRSLRGMAALFFARLKRKITSTFRPPNSHRHDVASASIASSHTAPAQKRCDGRFASGHWHRPGSQPQS